MLNKLDTRKKLFLFPILFIIIVGVMITVYRYYVSIYEARNSASIATEKFVSDMVKTRFSVLQFMRTSTQETEKVVQEENNKLIVKRDLSFKKILAKLKSIFRFIKGL